MKFSDLRVGDTLYIVYTGMNKPEYHTAKIVTLRKTGVSTTGRMLGFGCRALLNADWLEGNAGLSPKEAHAIWIEKLKRKREELTREAADISDTIGEYVEPDQLKIVTRLN